MKTASPTLQALLASNQLMYAHLYTLTLKNAVEMSGLPVVPPPLCYTDADQNLLFNGNTYLCTNPTVSKTGIKCSSDLSVDTVDVSLFGGADALVMGMPLPAFALNGGFDGAKVSIERCFMSPFHGDLGDLYFNAEAGVGTFINVFSGNVSEVKPSRTGVVLTVSTLLEWLTSDMPRNLLMPSCTATLYGATCGVTRNTYFSNDVVTAGSPIAIGSTAIVKPSGYFNLGVLEMTSGANTGVAATIKQHVYANGANTFTLAAPLASAPAVGDAFTVYPGCDKTMATCQGTFNNLGSFHGWPFVPSPTASI